MRQTTRRIAIFFCATLCLAVLSSLAEAQTYSILYNFSGACGGNFALGGATLDQSGRIYGTTYSGGAYGGGAVYRLAHEGEGWICSPVYNFGSQNHDGSNPTAGVVIGPDGLLYGTTTEGGSGYGTVFRLQPRPNSCAGAMCPWNETILYAFGNGADGGYPGYGKLTFDSAGNIYGTTNGGGSRGYGVVFKLTRSGSGWTESVIWDFANGGGDSPLSGVIFDNAGNLYGTTPQAVYELSPTQSGWIETTLSTTVGGAGGLIWDANGNLFGITGDAV